jgi:hypothetical protein
MVLVWFVFLHLPLNLYDREILEENGNILRIYLDKVGPKLGMYSYAQICDEVNLEEGPQGNIIQNM